MVRAERIVETWDVPGITGSVLFQALSVAWKMEAVRLTVGVIGCVLLVKLAYAVYRWRRWAAAGIDRIDGMSGLEFEQYLEYLFRRLGYLVERTRYSGDFGADLVVARKDERRVVQAKRKAGRVGVAAVQQAVAARAMYDCDTAMVVTNSSFTAQAEELAAANDVELWDRELLVAVILRAAPARPSVPSASPEERDRTESLPASPPCEGSEKGEPASTALCRTCGRQVPAVVREDCRPTPVRLGGQVYCRAHQHRGAEGRSRESASPRRRPGR